MNDINLSELRSRVNDLVSRDCYREGRQHLFPSSGALDWYVRQHKAELVARGAILLHAKRWLVNVRQMDAYVVEAGQRQAEKRGLLPTAEA